MKRIRSTPNRAVLYGVSLGIVVGLAMTVPSRPALTGEEPVYFEVCTPRGGLLHMRAGPGREFPSVAMLENQTRLEYLAGRREDPDAWIKVELFGLDRTTKELIQAQGYVRPRMLDRGRCLVAHDPALAGTPASRIGGKDIYLGRAVTKRQPATKSPSRRIPISPRDRALLSSSSLGLSGPNPDSPLYLLHLSRTAAEKGVVFSDFNTGSKCDIPARRMDPALPRLHMMQTLTVARNCLAQERSVVERSIQSYAKVLGISVEVNRDGAVRRTAADEASCDARCQQNVRDTLAHGERALREISDRTMAIERRLHELQQGG